jgi:ABC-type cobalt transport system substrate-binding protein
MEVFMTRRNNTILVILATFTLALNAFADETKTETAAAEGQKEEKLEVRCAEDYKPAPRPVLRFQRMGNLEDRSS